VIDSRTHDVPKRNETPHYSEEEEEELQQLYLYLFESYDEKDGGGDGLDKDGDSDYNPDRSIKKAPEQKKTRCLLLFFYFCGVGYRRSVVVKKKFF
jgi:hypothetical protein